MNSEFKTQFTLKFDNEITVDLFAGGGGASIGCEIGLGRPVDVAINHDENAISMHRLNHPYARHYLSDVFDVDPVEACADRPVGHLHASPDCTHHSQAGAGQPRKSTIRSLSWVVHKWAGRVKPRVITLENVEQILQWSPLVAKRCRKTGRVIKTDKSIAEPGELVPVSQQFLVPDKRHKGRNWQHFVDGLRRIGYAVQWRKLKACDYGAPTTRERLYLIARCDGEPIVWPAPTHFKNPRRGQKQWRTAAECIDWSLPSQSIFGRKKPLADATMRRIAKGVKKYILDVSEPFIVPIANYGGGDIVQPTSEPLRTITASPKGGSHAVVDAQLAPFVSTYYGQKNSDESRGADMRSPVATQTTENRFSLASAVIVGCGGRAAQSNPRDLRDPMATITAKADAVLATAFLSRQFGASIGQSLGELAPTTTAGGGGKSAVLELSLSPEDEANALRVAAFLIRYYSEGGQWGDLGRPIDTIATKDRLALVTIYLHGHPYVIVDITLRMLQPRELYRAQGFPESYVIDRGHDGRRFAKYQQVRFVGNSVSPPPMAAIVAANLGFAGSASVAGSA